jgi:hypothetical protein
MSGTVDVQHRFKALQAVHVHPAAFSNGSLDVRKCRGQHLMLEKRLTGFEHCRLQQRTQFDQRVKICAVVIAMSPPGT